ncbi:hypothetical protein ACIQW5_28075 [Methylorubrum thiocyanatum]|uniref:hypothetical protein n=1 Tax=Methylorubrum thiocyanatum TaxID=47958 RepID=UPI00383B4C6A
MKTGETELEMVWRHVRQGAEQVAKQRAGGPAPRGRPAEEAEALLDNFEVLQRQHGAHLARAEAKARQPG